MRAEFFTELYIMFTYRILQTNLSRMSRTVVLNTFFESVGSEIHFYEIKSSLGHFGDALLISCRSVTSPRRRRRPLSSRNRFGGFCERRVLAIVYMERSCTCGILTKSRDGIIASRILGSSARSLAHKHHVVISSGRLRTRDSEWPARRA